MKVRKVNINNKIKIEGFDYQFNGLKEIQDSYECYYNRCLSNLKTTQPNNNKSGIHIFKAFERYPCFDSHDFACENRYWQFYFFSHDKFTESQLQELSKINIYMNRPYPECSFPYIYYCGEGDEMLILEP